MKGVALDSIDAAAVRCERPASIDAPHRAVERRWRSCSMRRMGEGGGARGKMLQWDARHGGRKEHTVTVRTIRWPGSFLSPPICFSPFDCLFSSFCLMFLFCLRQSLVGAALPPVWRYHVPQRKKSGGRSAVHTHDWNTGRGG